MYSSIHSKNGRPLVTIYTQVYNTRPYLVQCIESVLSQTVSDFQYILVDNGCTDGSSEILSRYAQKDKRIKLIRYEKNQLGILRKLIAEHAKGQYLSFLDSDDWWEPDYLERLIEFLEKNDLDLAMAGTEQYFQKENISQNLRSVLNRLIMTQTQFAQNYLYVWTFPCTFWGSVMKLDLMLQTDLDKIIAKKYPYGGDTMGMLRYIRQCNRVGIDNSVLYHHRVHSKSISFQYNPCRFDANIELYEQMKEFMEDHRVLDDEKIHWLKRFHLASMAETLGTLCQAQIPTEQKLEECLRILQHPLTNHVRTSESEEQKQWNAVMWAILSAALADADAHPSLREPFVEALALLSPDSSKAFNPDDIGLLARKPALWEALKAGNPERLCGLLLDLIAKKKFSKQYDLGAILHRLIPQDSPLRNIEDTRFFRTYAQDCAEIFAGNQIAALDHMTRLLLEGKAQYAQEQFLDIYLSLAALENQVPAFLFGKVQLATLYLNEGRKEDCRAIANELAEMGLENEDFSALCRELRELEARP